MLLFKDFHKHFADPYPHFKTIVLDGIPAFLENIYQNHKHSSKSIKAIIGKTYNNFKTDYPAFKSVIQQEKIDLLICNFNSSLGCIEAANQTNVPYISTMAFAMSKDAGAPYVNNKIITRYDTTTFDMSFVQRFWDKFLVFPTLVFKAAERREVGVSDIIDELNPKVRHNSLKIVNSMYGIEAARPMGPLVEMFGPIIPRKYVSLTSKLKSFLENHRHIVYIPFGQHAIASEKDLKLILTSVLDNVENNVYGGNSTESPETVRTKSGNLYYTKDLFNQKYNNMRFVQWAPQTAAMMHPSVTVFLTHGGAGSFYEGLYSGKRLLIYPSFADQPGSSFTVQRNELSGYLRFDGTQEEVTNLMERVSRDITGEIQKNFNRFKALIQIHSRHGSLRVADLAEEVLYKHKDTLLPHRYEVSREMSFIKAHSIDLYAAASGIIFI
ncbi:glycosyltransferase family 1 protein, partial [Backusella circina FSU 941]